MDTFWSVLSALKGGCRRPKDDLQHGVEFESAFTYNTEREFANVYQSIDRDYSSVRNADERQYIAERKQNDGLDLSFSNLVELLCATLSFILLVCTLPFSLFFCLKFIPSFERLVVFRMGKIQKVAGPGTLLVLPCVDKTIKIDIRKNTIKIPLIQLISADKGIVELETVVFVRVNDPVSAVCTLQEHEKIIRNFAYTTLYNQMSRLHISDMTSPKTQMRVVLKVQEALNMFIKGSGVEVTEVVISAVRVMKPGENQTISLFQQLLSSDVGKQLMGALGEQAVEILSQMPEQAVEVKGAFDSERPSLSSASTMPVGELQVETNQQLDVLIDQIRRCCDSNLVSRIGKFYRIRCELDSRLYTIDLNLQCGDGYCVMAAPDPTHQPPADVTFSLTYSTLISLIRGEISPVSAYLNGNVRITGSVEDAMALNHLAARAKELKLELV